MSCTTRASLRTKRCALMLYAILLGILTCLCILSVNIHSFARSIVTHTVSEKDLSPGYQAALVESLQTTPCCKAANWTPTPEEIAAEQIPRIIHQTYKTRDIPEGDWTSAHELCLNLHRSTEQWRHILWTDETASRFIEHEYPEFFSTYQAYLYPIQRVDAMRYFILHHYGGVYIDLDIGCARSMESLLQFPAFFPRTSPTGVSNDLIGSRKGHPFMLELGEALLRQGGRMRYGTKYMTVFFSTGPMFVNRILARYWRTAERRAGADRVVILPRNFYSESLTAYFMHFPGSSWHGNDAHGVMLIYTYGWVVLLVSISVYLGYRLSRCRSTWTGRRRKTSSARSRTRESPRDVPDREQEWKQASVV